MRKLLRNKRGENYIDTVVGVVAAMMVIVVALNIFSFLTPKQDLDYYAKETRCRTETRSLQRNSGLIRAFPLTVRNISTHPREPYSTARLL